MQCKVYFLEEKEGGRKESISAATDSLINIHIEDAEFMYGCKLSFDGEIEPGDESVIQIGTLDGYQPFELRRGDSFSLYEGDKMIATGYSIR